jgi:hypothetical protein
MEDPILYYLTTTNNISQQNRVGMLSLTTFNHFDYNLKIYMGIERRTERSKLVSDNWKRLFKTIDAKDYKDGILLAEDDVLMLKGWSEIKEKVDYQKLNWIVYQKKFMDKTKEITAGAQLIYIPHLKIAWFKEKLLNSKSIHFDRFLSKLDIHYPFKAKECGIEIIRESATTLTKRGHISLEKATKLFASIKNQV